MRWPIRNQILVPFLAVVLLAVIATTAVAAVLAAARGERQTRAQLQNVIDTLAHTSVNYTDAGVLNSMHGLSGAHFVVCNAAGEVEVSTLPGGAPARELFANALGELESLGSSPTLDLTGTRYYMARISPRRGAPPRTLFVLYPEERWSQARWEAAWPPLIVGGLSAGLTSGVAVWLAHRFGARLRRLDDRVAAIAAGDFREIAVPGREDEIQDLVASVNRMSARLRDMQTAIRQSERTRLLAQLAGGMAHQLRNAVAGARMALQLHERRCDAASADQSLKVALRQLALMETQVRGLLSLGRGERRPDVRCDAAALLADVAALVEPACAHSRVALEVATRDSELCVWAEIEGLRAAVLNLTLNAIEAAGAGGHVALKARAEEATVVFEVIDTGPGPPAALAETLGEPFVTGKPEGVGLGLALARQVATDHGGALSWRRERDKTVFCLTLPAMQRVEERRESASARLRETEADSSIARIS